MSASLIDRLIADAAACVTCGREHHVRPAGPSGITWGDPDDGHPYRRKAITVDWLREWQRTQAMRTT